MGAHFQKLGIFLAVAAAGVRSSSADVSVSRIFETTFESQKQYADPFNDVDVDVIFQGNGGTWRVPTFWRGGSKWTVRFAPPSPGEYSYLLESTDRNNPDLNGHFGKISITAYAGTNAMLRHGMLQVGRNGRYFEHADGTPFYWLGDTMWTDLSSRISWEGFQELVKDRAAKGFTVAQTCAGLVPSNEELAPVDPGFANEGGPVWDSEFKRINPAYFDFADRRITYLIDHGIVPAIVGGWRQVIAQMGVAKMNKHWRYIVARYGAYPVFWIAGGEIYDPPANVGAKLPGLVHGCSIQDLRSPGWTEVVNYIRKVDPYHHPLTVHEIDPPFDTSVHDQHLTDFDLFQAGHRGWPSIATEVALLNTHYSRTKLVKPLVVGEIGYEENFGAHYEDFQRTAFWLAMLNGAAGFTYGTLITAEAYDTEHAFHRFGITSFKNWREGMALPGSYQTGNASKLLRQYPWFNFTPHPEWIAPRGTTLLEPQDLDTGFDIDLIAELTKPDLNPNAILPAGEWRRRGGTFKLPYAAGISGKIRMVYLPGPGRIDPVVVPTIFKLEPGVCYHSFYWEPTLGVKVDLGSVQCSEPGRVLVKEDFDHTDTARWTIEAGNAVIKDGALSIAEESTTLLAGLMKKDLRVAVDFMTDRDAELVLRHKDNRNYLLVHYSSADRIIFFSEVNNGEAGPQLGATRIDSSRPIARLTIEVHDEKAIAALSDGTQVISTPIVDLSSANSGLFGLAGGAHGQQFDNLEVRELAPAGAENKRDPELRDAAGGYRGTLQGPAWSDYDNRPTVLLDAYEPPSPPFIQDWVLVLERAGPH